jgi:hypothetical protein
MFPLAQAKPVDQQLMNAAGAVRPLSITLRAESQHPTQDF